MEYAADTCKGPCSLRVLIVNVVCGIRSTGRICTDIAAALEAQGHEVRIAYGREEVPERFQKYAVRIGSDPELMLHAVKARLFDACGFGSRRATEKFVEWAESYNPDLLWLHNLHGYYIHIGVLFRWIKSRPDMKVKWTLHDCWPFTGHCAYFSFVKCEKWKEQCDHCPQKREYPNSLLFDRSRKNYAVKKELFTNIRHLELITPSRWLADLTKSSFLREYSASVVYNTIDKSIFRPSPSDFREKYGIADRIMILGVASIWEDRKGLDEFYRLAGMLDERYVIVLVGLNEKQIKEIPEKVSGMKETGRPDDLVTVFSAGNDEVAVRSIIAVRKTNNPVNLAEIYTAADVFVNPTLEDNFPTVNLEAEACGTRVITYDVGGCRETLEREDSVVIPAGETEMLLEAIVR